LQSDQHQGTNYFTHKFMGEMTVAPAGGRRTDCFTNKFVSKNQVCPARNARAAGGRKRICETGGKLAGRGD
jgi:hypothetical protein